MTILGWVLTGGSILPLGVGIGFGVASLVPWDAYKNEGKLFDQPSLASQLDPAREEVWNSFLVTSIIADVGCRAGGPGSRISVISSTAARPCFSVASIDGSIAVLDFESSSGEQAQHAIAGAPVVAAQAEHVVGSVATLRRLRHGHRQDSRRDPSPVPFPAD